MKVKALAIALALAATGGTAEAAIANGSTLGSPSNLILSLVDNTTNISYFKDLGINYATLVNAAPGSINLNINLAADPAFGSALFSSGDSLTYNLTAVYSLDSTDNINQGKTGFAAAVFNDPSTPPSAWGLVTSVNTGLGSASSLLNTDGQVLGAATGTDVGAGFATGYLGSVGGLLGEASSVNAAPSGTPPVSVFSTLYGPGTQASGGTAALVFGNGTVGGELWYLTNPTLGTVGELTQLGTVNLSGAGLLTITAAAPVPVPAAVWLFGSALAGLIGFGRRGQKA